jgi:hypothetical protein
VSGQWKYLVSGQSIAGDAVTVVVKFGPTRMAVFFSHRLLGLPRLPVEDGVGTIM